MRELRGSSLLVGASSQRVRGPEDMGSRRKGDRAVTKAAVSHARQQFKANMCALSVTNLSLGARDNSCRAFWVPGKYLYFIWRRRSNIRNDARGAPWLTLWSSSRIGMFHWILFLSPPFPGGAEISPLNP